MQERRQKFRRMLYREGKRGKREAERELDKVAEGERRREEQKESQQRKGLGALRYVVEVWLLSSFITGT